ncbi:hypothetical protein [Gelidibacter gilvus]|uniref:DUF1795 domain-containing protein n=1 Tax=Gelidibacter gilvus TaxID=59602 RepID=A0A4Q0XJ94_9FLAO|nr:hypothetical protein [Gelidibacter gilvus]RXJ50278.1 hypothetical protein ESZ48_09885 [Gelidibacter gilvus]
MKKIILSFCVVLLLSSCKDEVKIPENFDYGKIESGVYDNKFFNFELAFNDQWSVQTKEEMQQMSENSRNTMAGDNQNLKSTLQASQVNVADLFSIFKFPVGSVTGGNASLIINAENLQSFPNVKTPRDYIMSARQLLDQTSLTLIYKKEPYTKTIGGKQFIGMEIFNQDYNLTQDYFVTLRNGFAISMVLSYDNAEDQQELYKMLDTIKFE